TSLISGILKDNGENILKEEKNLYVRNIEFLTSNINYLIKLTYFKKDGKIFIDGIGLKAALPGKRYSKRGWYHNNFISIFLDGKNLYEFPCKIEKKENSIILNFETQQKNSILSFSSENQSDKIFTEIKLPKRISSVKIELLCYPGNFNKGKYQLNDRWIKTPERDIQNEGEPNLKKVKEVILEKGEPWIYYYDKKNNPENKPYLSTCALLYNPKEIEKVGVKVGNYGIKTTIYGKKNTYHLIFWEFPGKDYKKCIEYMENLKLSF
ncbi:hypothetical protein J7L87_01550, partial [bacterium]|nr:hypothetical protein [bacterium]